jgi:hypothetical protein
MRGRPHEARAAVLGPLAPFAVAVRLVAARAAGTLG